MLHIYVCEDNSTQRAIIKNCIEKTILIEELDAKIIMDTACPDDILSTLQKHSSVGLYFLDIDLNANMNGIVLAQHIRKIDPRGFIVFVTSHSEMSMLTFNYKVEALDFILKDSPDTVRTHIHDCILKANERYSSTNNTAQKNFSIKINDKNLVIDYKDILFFETSFNIHKVNLLTLNRKIEFIGQLKDIESSVDERFYRCHRSFLINTEHIKEINIKKRIVTMKNDAICLISVRQLQGLKSILKK